MSGPIFELTLIGSGSNYSPNYDGKCFYSGQTITGKVEFETKKQMKNVNILFVNFRGEKAVKWKNYEYDGQETSEGKVKGCETIIQKKVVLKWWPTGVEGCAWKYVFPFSFKIPQDIPCSFEGQYGHVRYSVEAKLEGPGNLLSSHTSYMKRLLLITINNPMNLNEIPACNQPVSMEESIGVGNFGWKPGTVSCNVKMPRMGYTSGETIPISLCLNNKSDRRITKAEVKLVMCIVYKSPCNNKKTENNTCSKVKLKGVQAGENISWTNIEVPVPPIPASNLGVATDSSIIDVSYRIEIHVTPSGLEYTFELFNNKLVLGVPIIIGVIPLRNLATYKRSYTLKQNGHRPRNALELVDNGGEPSAPFDETYEYELPPPTYEEAMIMNQCRLSSFIDISDSYRPMYPIWNLD